jgi:hypothetical protein
VVAGTLAGRTEAAKKEKLLKYTRTLYGGLYVWGISMRYRKKTVTSFRLDITIHPYRTTVEGLLFGTGLLNSQVLESREFHGSQPLFTQVTVLDTDDTPLTVQSIQGWWYLIDGIWQPEGIASTVAEPGQIVSLVFASRDDGMVEGRILDSSPCP